MKLSYIAPCVGACAVMMMSSCSSTNRDADGYSDSVAVETALPLSEVADGEIPPWLLDDDGSNGGQMDAGARTPEFSRSDFPMPEPGQEVATAESGGAASQKQPEISAPEKPDAALAETLHPMDGVVDPLAQEEVRPLQGASGSSGAVTQKKTSTQKKSSDKKSSNKQTSKKPKQPTMVVYKVRPGDSLSEIASRSNTTVSQIMRDSNLTSTTIRPGQTIKVRYTPKGYKADAKDNKSKGGKTHTVSSGQTLSGIASRYGVTTSELMKANGLTETDAKKLRPGQELKIPSKKTEKSGKSSKKN